MASMVHNAWCVEIDDLMQACDPYNDDFMTQRQSRRFNKPCKNTKKRATIARFCDDANKKSVHYSVAGNSRSFIGARAPKQQIARELERAKSRELLRERAYWRDDKRQALRDDAYQSYDETDWFPDWFPEDSRCNTRRSYFDSYYTTCGNLYYCAICEHGAFVGTPCLLSTQQS